MLSVALLALVALLPQGTPQNPSPMSDTTRPHPRVSRYDVPGRRAALSTGTLYISDRFKPRGRVNLVVHFHGAPWLVEHHVRSGTAQAALVTVQLGSGSRVYADAFADAAVFTRLLDEAASRLRELTGRPVEWEPITLSSFSAGFGAIRSILQHPDHVARIGRLVLADSLHAAYAAEPGPSRAADLPVDETSLQPFIRFAIEATAGRRQMRVTHSEVFPGTFASTTETADVLLRHAQLPRRRVLRDGPIGMQQLSEARKGRFELAGFAGNSAPDHMDHLYALGRFLEGR